MAGPASGYLNFVERQPRMAQQAANTDYLRQMMQQMMVRQAIEQEERQKRERAMQAAGSVLPMLFGGGMGAPGSAQTGMQPPPAIAPPPGMDRGPIPPGPGQQSMPMQPPGQSMGAPQAPQGQMPPPPQAQGAPQQTGEPMAAPMPPPPYQTVPQNPVGASQGGPQGIPPPPVSRETPEQQFDFPTVTQALMQQGLSGAELWRTLNELAPRMDAQFNQQLKTLNSEIAMLKAQAAMDKAGRPGKQQMRTISRGTDEVQQEFDEASGQWKDVGRGPRFKPGGDGGGEKLPKPKPGWRYKADGSGDQERIPGGPEDVKYRGQIGKAQSSLTAAEQELTLIANTARDILNSGGLGRITGVAGALPNVPGGKGADTQAKLDQLKGLLGFAKLQDMRAASPTGGALGSVSNFELSALQNSAAALQTAQSEEAIARELRKLANQVNSTRTRLRSAFNEQYSDGSGGGAPSVGTKRSINGVPATWDGKGWVRD